MAIVGAIVTSLFSGTNATSYVAGSATPPENALLLAYIQSEFVGVTNVPTGTAYGASWSELTNYVNDSSGTTSRMTILAALSGASPSTSTFTADFAGQTELGCNIIVVAFTGVDLSGTAIQAIAQFLAGSVNSAGTSESITLASAITLGNATAGFFHHQAAENSTVGSGYTALGNGNHAGPNSSMMSEWRADGNTVVNASWTTSIAKGGIALEIKASSQGKPRPIQLINQAVSRASIW